LVSDQIADDVAHPHRLRPGPHPIQAAAELAAGIVAAALLRADPPNTALALHPDAVTARTEILGDEHVHIRHDAMVHPVVALDAASMHSAPAAPGLGTAPAENEVRLASILQNRRDTERERAREPMGQI
jgi:hypothetical protein